MTSTPSTAGEQFSGGAEKKMGRVLKNITNGSKQRTETKRQRRGVAAAGTGASALG